jgi:hypothetical protein
MKAVKFLQERMNVKFRNHAPKNSKTSKKKKKSGKCKAVIPLRRKWMTLRTKTTA